MKTPRLFASFWLVSLVAWLVPVSLPASQFVQPSKLNAFRDAAVYSVCQDSTGTIWMNTGYGVFTYDGIRPRMVFRPVLSHCLACNGSNYVYSVTYRGVYRFDIGRRNPVMLKSDINSGWHSSAFLAEGDSLWVAIEDRLLVSRGDSLEHVATLKGADFSYISRKGDSIIIGDRKGDIYDFGASGFRTLFKASAGISCIYPAADGNLWLGLSHGGITLLRKDYSSVPITGTLPEQEVRSFCSTEEGDILAGAADGLFRINGSDYECSQEHSGMPVNEPVWELFKDRDRNIWVCTFYSGLWYRNYALSAFRVVSGSDSLKMVSGITEDENCNLWIVTDNHGMFRMSPEGDISEIPSGRSIKFQTAVYDKESKEIWIGSFRDSLNIFNPETEEWRKIAFKDENGQSLGETVSFIHPQGEELFLGTSSGLYVFNPKTESFISRHVPGYTRSVYAIRKIDDNHLALSGMGAFIYDIQADSLSALPVSGNCSDIQIGEDGDFYVCVTGRGLCRIRAKDHNVYQFPNSSLLDAFVAKLFPCGGSNFLITSRKGMSLIREDGSLFRNFEAAGGLGVSSFRGGCFVRVSDGSILVGGKEGIVRFNPSLFSAAAVSVHRPSFADIIINGKSISGDVQMPFVEALILQPGQSNLSVEISTYDYSGALPLDWAYRLDGFDSEWTSFNPDNPIIYMNLRPGKYRLRVRYGEGGNAESSEEISLPIRLKAYWYACKLAKVLYVLAFFAIIIIIFSILYSRMLLRQRLMFEESEGSRRMQLFVDVSRSLRGPLSMILGQLELFFQRYASSSPQGLKYIERSYQNARNMQSIISGYVDLENENEEIKQVQALRDEPTETVQAAPEISKNYGLQVLIVADDPDARAMLRSVFGRSYEVLVSSDTEDAYSSALKEQPDIVVCDIQSGYDESLDLCTKLRRNYETSHIPFVLLTAHASEQKNIEGVRMGVDAFIVKPYRTEMLIEQCKALLENRRILRDKYTIAPPNLQTKSSKRKDYNFLNAAIGAVERNLYASDLNVRKLCQELHVSKTALNNKLRSIADCSPREFIEDIRLRHAAQMLLDSNKLISEISDELGFSSYRYFAIRFKKRFGMTPSQYATGSTDYAAG